MRRNLMFSTLLISVVVIQSALADTAGALLTCAWPTLSLPPNTQAQSIARTIVFNGLNMRARVFHSPRRPGEIVAFYRKRWKGSVVVNTVGSQQVVGHRAGDYFITIQVQPDGTGSKGDIGIVDVAHAAKGVVLGEGLPRPGGALVFNDIRYPDDRTPSRTVAMIDTLSPKQNAQYYRDHLTADNWKPVLNHCSSNGCVLRFERGDQKLGLTITSTHSIQSRLVFIIQHP